uniref:Uncharacterized protein n=1 Tax=Anguilla anguilla TaxID=7936 RepID=A0A0E9Q7Q0_ANGAN
MHGQSRMGRYQVCIGFRIAHKCRFTSTYQSELKTSHC